MGTGVLVAMYGLVLAVGLFAGRRRRSRSASDETELMLAGRSLPLWVALFTMTATWVGGGYLNGTAEFSFAAGALWGAQAGIGFALSLILGGFFFARPMRRRNYVTLVDPLAQRYGGTIAAVLMIPAILAEVIWSGAILVAIGTTVSTLLGTDVRTAIVWAAAVAIGYTATGGLRSVAYTDVVQLLLIVVGLGLALPFVVDVGGGLSNILSTAFPPMSGHREVISYFDLTIVLVLGGIPWNVYFQRVLASKNERVAVQLSLAAGPLCALLAVPPLLMGLAASHVDWMEIAGPDQTQGLLENGSLVLPFLLKYTVPSWVSWLALGAISAAVMSSVDSSILSASSLVAWNGYRRLFNPTASPKQTARLVRVLILILGLFAMTFALIVPSVKELWYLCGDVVYCVLFPQLVLALFDRKANGLGAITGFLTSSILRLGGGVERMGVAPFLPYPDWMTESSFDFPFRSFAMAVGLVTSFFVSRWSGRWFPSRPIEPGNEIR